MVINIDPRFIPQAPGSNWSFGRPMVPYQAPGLPAQLSGLGPQGYQPNFTMQGGPYTPAMPGLPATIPGAVEAGVPEAVTAGEPAGAAAGRLGFLRALGVPAAMLAGAAYADPGSTGYGKKMADRTVSDGSLVDALAGAFLQDQPEDKGLTSMAKSVGRGAVGVKDKMQDWAKELWGPEGAGYLWTSKEDRDKAALAKQPLGPIGGEVPLEGEGQGDSTDQTGKEWVIPQSGGNTASGVGSSLDDMMKVLASEKPGKAQLPADLQFKQLVAGFLGGLDNSIPSNSGALAKAVAGGLGGSIKNQLQEISVQQHNTKAMQDWMENYAKTGVDVAKVKHDISKDDFKIHTTKNGFLIEMTEGDKKVLKPISANIFGAPAGQKMSIGPTKFDANNPLKDELGVLQNLHSVGVLNDVMVDNGKALMKSTKGLSDPKQLEEAKVLALARAMHQSPGFKATLVQKYLSAVGKKPRAPVYEAPSDTSPEAPDWLTELDNARNAK